LGATACGRGRCYTRIIVEEQEHRQAKLSWEDERKVNKVVGAMVDQEQQGPRKLRVRPACARRRATGGRVEP